ncbi:MAG: TIGR02996 domain-containing protein, partial [Terriglobales bacterium]
MSDEDAFLDGIAANRADRTRLLVFADWLADHGDP